MLMLLPLVFLTVPCAVQLPGAGETPGVVRSYDVRAASPICMFPEHTLVLLPLLRDFGDSYPSALRDPIGGDASLVASFLRGLDPAQWEYEGREMGMTDGEHLRVVAPPALQDVVSRALVFLEETISRPTTVVVDFVSFGPNPGIATLPPLLPASEVARWTAIGTGHESYELTVRPGEMSTQRAERTVAFAINNRVQIAERAAAYELKPDRVTVGTAIDLSVAPGTGGSWLALVLRNGRFLDTDGVRDETLKSSVTHDQAVEVMEHQKVRSDPRLANHSLAVNAFLPDGKALAFVTSAGLESRVMFVRQAGPTPPSVVALPEDLKRVTSRNATVLVRTDGVNVPNAFAHSFDDTPYLLPLDTEAQENGDDTHVRAEVRRTSRVEALGMLSNYDGEYEAVELGPFVAVMGATREPIDRAIAKFMQSAPAPQSIAVTLTLKRGTRDATVLARAVLPLRVGERSVIVLGRESVADLIATTDIAQGAAAMDTYIGCLFDGISVSVAPLTSVGGALALDIDAHARWSRVQPRDFEGGGALATRIQLPDADLLDVRRTVTLPKAETGPRKVTLGNSGTSGEALTLDIEVVDLR